MDLFSIDFRFCDIERELWALDEFVNIVERHIPVVEKEETRRTHDRLHADGHDWNDPEVDIALQQLHDTVQTIVPRFFRGQVLVTLWAIFQGTTNEIAEYIRINKNLDKKWRRARGDNDLCKLRTYFAEDLEFPLFVDREIEERLDMLLVLRNVLAHANGRMDGESCDPARRVRIEQYQNQGVGISRYPEALIFSEEFIRLMCASVGDYCRDLMKRVRASY